MAEDWAADVRNYAPDADDAVIRGIVRHCGIALQNRDSSLVSFSDPSETARVRDGFCRKKLALTDSDDEIDTVIARVGERMAGNSTRNRVTVYYLIAEAFGKLGLFGSAAGAASAATVAPAATVVPPETTIRAGSAGTAAPLMAAGAGAATASFAAPAAAPAAHRPVAAAPGHHAAAVVEDERGPGIGVIGLVLGGLVAVVIGTGALATMFGTRTEPVEKIAPADLTPRMAAVVPVDGPAPQQTAAAAPAAVAVPEGAGVVAQDVDGKPLVSVYFDTAKTAIAPDFATVAAPVKAWVDANPGARVAVSGFNDPTGNAAFNAELSKNRAQAVAAALAGIGVSAAAIDLEKPPETTDTGTSAANARRVDIMVRAAG